MAFTVNSYSADDLRKVKEAIKQFPVNTSRASMGAQLSALWKEDPEKIERWITVAESFSDEVINLFESGKINRNRLNEIAKSKYPNPSYKDFIARKAIEFGLSKKDLEEIHEHLKAGKHPVEAIEITRGIRSEKAISTNDALSIDRIVKEWERDGFAWRQRGEILRQQGKIQVLQNGQLKSRIVYSLAAMKVACDDMRRYIEELWKEVPPEMQRAVEAEFNHDHSAQEAPVDEVQIVPVLPQVGEPQVPSEQ